MAAGMSDIIAGFINDILSQTNGTAELQRAELANRFKCVPSQINYVISTRFSPEHGYIVESRRGGGGYIRITKVRTDPKMLVMHTVNAVGDSISLNSAAALISNLLSENVMSEKAAKLMIAAIGNNAMRPAENTDKDRLRASIFKQMLINLI
jgi:transcriptional regulator of stress and heat shock response